MTESILHSSSNSRFKKSSTSTTSTATAANPDIHHNPPPSSSSSSLPSSSFILQSSSSEASKSLLKMGQLKPIDTLELFGRGAQVKTLRMCLRRLLEEDEYYYEDYYSSNNHGNDAAANYFPNDNDDDDDDDAAEDGLEEKKTAASTDLGDDNDNKGNSYKEKEGGDNIIDDDVDDNDDNDDNNGDDNIQQQKQESETQSLDHSSPNNNERSNHQQQQQLQQSSDRQQRQEQRQQRLQRLRERRRKKANQRRRYNATNNSNNNNNNNYNNNNNNNVPNSHYGDSDYITTPPDPIPQKRECVFVWGHYGCGKKALVTEALKHWVVKERNGWFVKGVFDVGAGGSGSGSGNGGGGSGIGGSNGNHGRGSADGNHRAKQQRKKQQGNSTADSSHATTTAAANNNNNSSSTRKINVRFEDEESSLTSLSDHHPSNTASGEGGAMSGMPFSGIISACRELCSELLILKASEEGTGGGGGACCTTTSDGTNAAAAKEGGGAGQRRRSSVRWNMSHLFDDTKQELKQVLSMEDRQLLVAHGLSDLVSILDMNDNIISAKDEDTGMTINFLKKRDLSTLSSTSSQHHLRGAQKQLHYAFQKFFRVMSQLHGPLVVVLDGLQFADTSSLDLLQALLFDREITNLMVVGCIRTLEDQESSLLGGGVEENGVASTTAAAAAAATATATANDILRRKCANQKLVARIDKWKNKGESCGLTITDVVVGNYDLDTTTKVVMELLSIDEDTAFPLAELCHERTRGNPLFLFKFMNLLWKEKLIEFNIGTFSWKWDLQEIAAKTMVSVNVKELMIRDISKMSKEVRSVLVLASCLGTSFNEKSIFLVWDKMGVNSFLHQGDRTRIRSLLNKAVDASFLERIQEGTYASRGGRNYRWTHDKVMDAAISNIEADALAALRFEVGSTLFSSLPEDELEENIFTVANLVNSGGRSVLGSLESKRRVQLAFLNLLAARRAVEFSAFSSAARYAKVGVELLPPNRRWKDHRDLMLELSSISAEVAGSLSKRRDLERWSEEILCRNELTVFDKLRAYMSLIDSMGKNGYPDQAADLCRAVLESLGCIFSIDQVRWDEEAMRSRLEANRDIVNDMTYTRVVECLPRMEDREKMESITILTRLCSYLIILQDREAFMMAVSRLARWTFHYGLSNESPVVFAFYALSFIIQQDFAAGAMNGKVALALLENTNNRNAKAKTLFFVWFMVMPWTRHVRDSEKPLVAAYNYALQCGEMEVAFSCIFGKLIVDLVSGRPLKQIEEVCRAFVPQIEQLTLVGTLMRILWQTVLNLMGECENVNVLVGEAWDEVDFCRQESPQPFVSNYYKALKSYLFLFSGEYQLGVDFAIERNDQFLEGNPGSALGLVDLVSRGVPLYEAAQKRKKKRYVNASNSVRKTCASWIKNGACSVLHHGFLLDAEKAVLNGKLDDAKTLYKKGIVFASRAGFIQDMALLNDRYSSFLFSRQMNKEEAKYHFDKAIVFYLEWGAKSHVHLRNAV